MTGTDTDSKGDRRELPKIVQDKLAKGGKRTRMGKAAKGESRNRTEEQANAGSKDGPRGTVVTERGADASSREGSRTESRLGSRSRSVSAGPRVEE